MFLISPNLSGISHGFFTRQGGTSGGIYASLNCGWGSDDNKICVTENRERVARALGTDGAHLLSLYQVHGDKVITVTTPWTPDHKPQADAMVTATPGIALGVLAADCVPVLFADKKRGIVGAAHSGWKGTLAGVLERILDAMCAFGSRPSDIAAAIGPCIGHASYEVGAEFRDRFMEEDKGFARYFIPAARGGFFLFDIRSRVRDILEKAGTGDINTLENDTYIEEDAFFSFRRATHRKEPDYGRQISAIMLTP
jgi:YfiH family protein